MDNIGSQSLKLSVMAGALVNRQEDLAEAIILELKEYDVKREEIREAILQVYLFDGYPTALEGMVLLNQIWPEDANPGESPDFSNWQEWAKRGEELYRRIYGDVADKLQENAIKLSPELALWMRVEGYGKVLSRNNLDVKTRELINVSVLIVKKRPRQLYSHLRGSLRVGSTRQEIMDLINALDSKLISVDTQWVSDLFKEIKI